MQKERPDLMRGKVWNFFRLLLSDFDLKRSYKAIILQLIAMFATYTVTPALVGHVHTLYNSIFISLLHNGTKNKATKLFPHIEYKIERDLAHKELGHDPRTKKRFGRFF